MTNAIACWWCCARILSAYCHTPRMPSSNVSSTECGGSLPPASQRSRSLAVIVVYPAASRSANCSGFTEYGLDGSSVTLWYVMMIGGPVPVVSTGSAFNRATRSSRTCGIGTEYCAATCWSAERGACVCAACTIVGTITYPAANSASATLCHVLKRLPRARTAARRRSVRTGTAPLIPPTARVLMLPALGPAGRAASERRVSARRVSRPAASATVGTVPLPLDSRLARSPRPPLRVAHRGERERELPHEHGGVEQREQHAVVPEPFTPVDAVVEPVEQGHREDAADVPVRQRPLHVRVEHERLQHDLRRDQREEDPEVERRRHDRVLAPHERARPDRLADPALLPPHLLAQELLHRLGDDRVRVRVRRVEDAPVAEQEVGQAAVVAVGAGLGQERLVQPLVEDAVDGLAPVPR